MVDPETWLDPLRRWCEVDEREVAIVIDAPAEDVPPGTDVKPVPSPSSPLSFLLRKRMINGRSSFEMPGITLS